MLQPVRLLARLVVRESQEPRKVGFSVAGVERLWWCNSKLRQPESMYCISSDQAEQSQGVVWVVGLVDTSLSLVSGLLGRRWAV